MSTVADKLAKKSSRQGSSKQVRLRLVYIDFWSAVKLSFLAAVAIAIVTVVSFFLIFMVVQTTGLIGQFDEFFQSFSENGVRLLSASTVGQQRFGQDRPVIADCIAPRTGRDLQRPGGLTDVGKTGKV